MYMQEIHTLLAEYFTMLNNSGFSSKNAPLTFMEYVSLRRSEGEVYFITDAQWYNIRTRREKESVIKEKIEDIKQDF